MAHQIPFTKREWNSYITSHNFQLDQEDKIALGKKCTFVLFRVFVDHFWREPSTFYIRRADKKIEKARGSYTQDETWVKSLVKEVKAPDLKELKIQQEQLLDALEDTLLQGKETADAHMEKLKAVKRQIDSLEPRSSQLVEAITTKPFDFATLLMPMFEPLATGSSELFQHDAIRENLQRLLKGHENTFKAKISYPIEVFHWMLDTEIKKHPENTLGTNIKETGLEVLRQARTGAIYLQDHAADIEVANFAIPDVDPGLGKYLQGLLTKINTYKKDTSKGIPMAIQWAVTFKTYLSPMLKWRLAQWGAIKGGTPYIMNYILPLFNNPPLTERDKNALSSLVESALRIALEKGFAQKVFDFLSVAVECKTLSVEELIKKAMPHMIGFIDVFETEVINKWNLDPAVTQILKTVN
ncbi:MAG: hypothetical protein LLF94_01215 [Chlamydiales bacterium]|nr:hypothetical protein [Chlamydiales bacterium]